MKGRGVKNGLANSIVSRKAYLSLECCLFQFRIVDTRGLTVTCVIFRTKKPVGCRAQEGMTLVRPVVKAGGLLDSCIVM
jgi:hypothetical protein